jgi:transposase
MAQGTRVQVVLPPGVAQQLKQRASLENRTVSNLAAYMIESALRATSS